MAAAAADLIGRDEELAAIARFLEPRAPACAVAIEGEPGIGKTTVWEAAVAEAAARGARGRRARADAPARAGPAPRGRPAGLHRAEHGAPETARHRPLAAAAPTGPRALGREPVLRARAGARTRAARGWPRPAAHARRARAGSHRRAACGGPARAARRGSPLRPDGRRGGAGGGGRRARARRGGTCRPA